MRSVRLLLFVSMVGLLLAACGGVPQAAQPTAVPEPAMLSGEITVFAAASLTDAFEAIGEAFRSANPDVVVNFNFANSAQLATQINEGAPVDVFASANPAQMQVAIEGGRIADDAHQLFVRNKLVVITPSDNPANVTNLEALARPGLRLILADPVTPIGQNSQEFLEKASAQPEFGADFRDQVLANVVSYEDTVRLVLTKIGLGEGDAAVVFTTDAVAEAENVQQIAIPDDLNVIADYLIAPVADSPNLALAEAFVAFIRSAEGQAILAGNGFISVE